MTPTTLFEKIWSAHEVAPGLIYIDLHLVHEVTSAAGLRGPAARRPRGPPPRPHARHRRPQRADRRHAGRRPRSATSSSRRQVETLEAQLRRVRHPAVLARLRPPGDRPHHRARARRHPAGHDDRLRRLAHRHPRRVRRARVRDRHERGRARPGHADARRSRKPKSMRINYAGALGHGVTAEGPDPRHDRPDGHQRRRRPRRRVRRRRDRGALDGGPDDDLQHDDRGRRPRRHDRAGRHDVRVGRGPRRARPRTSTRPSRTGASCTPTTARRFDREIDVDAARAARRSSPGARRPARSSASATRCPSRAPRPTSARCATWALEAGTPMQEIRLDRVFIGSCTNARIGDLRAAARGGRRAARSPPTSTRWSSPAPSRCARRPRPRASTRSSAPPASTGAPRAARCAWA